MEYVDFLERVAPLALRRYWIGVIACIVMALSFMVSELIDFLPERNKNSQSSPALLTKKTHFLKRGWVLFSLLLIVIAALKGVQLFEVHKRIEQDIIGHEFLIYEGEISLVSNHGVDGVIMSELSRGVMVGDAFVRIVEFDESWDHALELSETSVPVRVVYGKNSLIVVKIEPIPKE